MTPTPPHPTPAGAVGFPPTLLRVCPECAGPLVRASGCLSAAGTAAGVAADERRGSSTQLAMPAPAVEPRLGSVLDERQRGTRFLALPVRSVLNTRGRRRTWASGRSIPYVGCEFGCTYCYARDTHRYTMERSGAADAEPMPAWQAFERRILVKTDVVEVLARTLDPARLGGQLAGHRHRHRSATSRPSGSSGSPADPRAAAAVSRALDRDHHQVAAGHPRPRPAPAAGRAARGDGQHLARHADARLARRLELRSPVPAARIRGARAGSPRAGVYAGLLVAPILPGITDDRRGSGRLMGAAKEAGARYVVGSALRLGPAARHRFLPVLAREFPALAERYARHYARREGVSPAYQRALSRPAARALQRRHGFPLDEGMKRRRRARRSRSRARRGRGRPSRSCCSRPAAMRSVLFVDPPAFCTTVEGLVAPALRTRPVAVAPPGADRATILALSAEARLAGIERGHAGAAGAQALPRSRAAAAQSAALRPRLARAARGAPDLRAGHRAARLRPRLSRSHRHRPALRARRWTWPRGCSARCASGSGCRSRSASPPTSW